MHLLTYLKDMHILKMVVVNYIVYFTNTIDNKAIIGYSLRNGSATIH